MPVDMARAEAAYAFWTTKMPLSIRANLCAHLLSLLAATDSLDRLDFGDTPSGALIGKYREHGLTVGEAFIGVADLAAAVGKNMVRIERHGTTDVKGDEAE